MTNTTMNTGAASLSDQHIEQYQAEQAAQSMGEPKRGTDAQILYERELTVSAINGAMAFGYQDTNPPPTDDHWLAPFWKIGRKQAELEASITTRQADAAPSVAEKFVPDAAMNFAAYLIDHCEGETITEESLQVWLGKMVKLPRYNPSVESTLASMTRMFHAACADLGAINEALGLDPDDGGAEPILEAIAELRAAIAAGGAQEAIYQVMVGEKWVDSTAAEYAAVSNEKRIVYAAPLPREAATVPDFDMLAHLQRQRDFSERTFGPGARTKGVVDHIRKELVEIEQNPGDFSEWADVVILGLDGFWRAGASPQQIIDTIVAKQTKNEGRTWPDWRTADPNKAIEHDRSGEQCPQCNGKGAVLFRDPEEAWDMTCGICKGTGAAPAASNGEQA